MSKKISELIEKRKREINSITKELLVLMDREVFENENFIEVDEVIKIKTGRKKTDFIEYKIKVGYRTWVEDFVDEDTGEVVSIDRRERVSINGKRANRFGKSIERIDARLYEVFSDKPIWEM